MGQKIAVFISGKGSNLHALLQAGFDHEYWVYGDRECEGLNWAKEFDVPHEIINFRETNSWENLLRDLKKQGISTGLLLGFMRILPPKFLTGFPGELINLHPSMLPLYPGLKAIDRAFEDRAILGATLHRVTEGVDEGPVVVQETLPNPYPQSVDEAYERVHQLEHGLVCGFVEGL